ncbi:ATP-binding protein [Desulfosarcina sp. OttesenSCG-928-B08]|nr:ATP-binding protein [Desulfosarcina sp. OttesenSCG-928-B08]
MKHEMAMTTNVRRFLAAVRDLVDRPSGVEGMALLWGQPGEGKSTSVAYVANAMDGIFLRANACWSVTTMLGALMVELGKPPKRQRAPMVEAAAQALMEKPRPIFVDEADYLLRQADMLDVLRDIYDTTGSPVVLIGMEDMARKVQENGRVARRITQWVEFRGVSLQDARVLADTVCEVKVEDDLLVRLHDAGRKNIGRMTTGLSRIEKLAKTNALSAVSSEIWGDRAFFFDQPVFKRNQRR